MVHYSSIHLSSNITIKFCRSHRFYPTSVFHPTYFDGQLVSIHTIIRHQDPRAREYIVDCSFLFGSCQINSLAYFLWFPFDVRSFLRVSSRCTRFDDVWPPYQRQFCVVLVCASSNVILLASVSICRIRSPSHNSVLTQGKHLRHQILHNQIACCSANGVERNSGLHDSETHHILVIRCDCAICLTN